VVVAAPRSSAEERNVVRPPSDPDGYKIEFESLTDVPEDMQYCEPR
jgi:hypothetical protein